MVIAMFHCPFAGLSGCRDGVVGLIGFQDLGVFERVEVTLKRMGIWLCGVCFKTHTTRTKCRHGVDIVSPPDISDGFVRFVLYDLAKPLEESITNAIRSWGVPGGSLQLVRETLTEYASLMLDLDEENLDMCERNLKECKRKICDGHYTAAVRVLSSSCVALYNDATLQDLKSCGRDGLRAQHLMDCLSRAVVAISDELFSSITQVVNIFFEGGWYSPYSYVGPVMEASGLQGHFHAVLIVLVEALGTGCWSFDAIGGLSKCLQSGRPCDYVRGGFGDWQWLTRPFLLHLGGLVFYSARGCFELCLYCPRFAMSAALQTKLLRHVDIVAHGSTFDTALCMFNTCMEIDFLSNPSEIAAPKLMKKMANIYFTRVTKDAESSFSLSPRQMALWQSQREEHTSDWLRVVLISGSAQLVLRSFTRGWDFGWQRSDIGLGGGCGQALRPADMLLYSWEGGLDVCVDLTGSSPLTQTGMAGFVPGRAVIDVCAAQKGVSR
ncbi:hypothetical protein Tco_0459787 [Tanacetum coccineum]